MEIAQCGSLAEADEFPGISVVLWGKFVPVGKSAVLYLVTVCTRWTVFQAITVLLSPVGGANVKDEAPYSRAWARPAAAGRARRATKRIAVVAKVCVLS